MEVVSGTRSSWGIFGSALHVFIFAFLFGLLDWMVFIRQPAHVRWQGIPWPQGERQPIVKVKPAELFLNTNPLKFASCTCPNYWSGYFTLEQQGLEESDRQKMDRQASKSVYSIKSPEANGLIVFVICEAYWHCFKKCLPVKRKLESVTVSGDSGS